MRAFMLPSYENSQVLFNNKKRTIKKHSLRTVHRKISIRTAKAEIMLMSNSVYCIVKRYNYCIFCIFYV